jgi:hypothetical protein
LLLKKSSVVVHLIGWKPGPSTTTWAPCTWMVNSAVFDIFSAFVTNTNYQNFEKLLYYSDGNKVCTWNLYTYFKLLHFLNFQASHIKTRHLVLISLDHYCMYVVCQLSILYCVTCSIKSTDTTSRQLQIASQLLSLIPELEYLSLGNMITGN